MKKRILFVDDQSNVLSGLRRTLHVFAGEWGMDFVASGREALERFQEAPYDVVVADMMMPGMDGAALLEEVRHRWSDTVRIILSGQANEEAIRRSVGPAHRYLTKPCAPELLKATVASACALRERLANEPLRRLISQLTTVPSLPRTFSQLIEEVRKPEPSLRRIGELIACDVGMTAKLLQLLNSSFFGLPRHIKDPVDAVRLMGLNTLKPLILAAGIFTQFGQTLPHGYSVEEVTEHSIAVGITAQRIARTFSSTDRVCDFALMAGTLHDIGQLILATNLPIEFERALRCADDRQMSLYAAETQTIGVSHAEVGGYLLALWGLPDEIVEAVTFHHEPDRCLESSFSALTAVHIANVLLNRTHLTSEARVVDFDLDYLTRIGIPNPSDPYPEFIVPVSTESAVI